MLRTVIGPDGLLDLGAAARRAGFLPGQLVDIIVTCSGSLIVALADDDSKAVDAFARRLPAATVPALVSGVTHRKQ